MLGRAARLILRLAGWLLTPLVIVLAGALGAAIGLFLSNRLPVEAGLILTVVTGFVGAALGVLAWLRLLRRSPELQDVLEVTPEGVPRPEAVEELIHPADLPRSGDPS